jgi:hypothetical protein
MNNGKAWNINDKRWKTVYRWMWIWSPDDCNQCVALAHLLLGNNAAQGAMMETVKYLLRELRYEVWNIKPSKKPKMPRALKPSRIARRSGYRTNKK